MSILLYVNGNDSSLTKRLQEVIERTVPQETLEIFHSYENFSKRIQQFPKDIKVAVLVAHNKDQLSLFISLKDYLEGIRIILILPDLERETVSKGLPLSPVFIEYVRGDFTNVGLVLEKLSKKINNNQTNKRR